MRKYAIIKNSVVCQIVDLEEDLVEEYSRKSESLVDISDSIPQPQIGWVLNGNTLQFPTGVSDREKLEIELAEKKTDFGTKLSRVAINKIGARNKILDKNGSQVAVVLNALVGVKLLLETGALGTARYSCTQLKAVYTEYGDIFDFVIKEINNFESNFGL